MAMSVSCKGENMVRFYQKSTKKLALAYAKKAEPKKVTTQQRKLKADIFD